MVSELVKNRLQSSVGKKVTIFIFEKNYCYEGKITGCDDDYVEIIHFRTGKFKIINLCDIKDCEVEP